MRFTASNDKPNMFRGFYALLLAYSRTYTHTHTCTHSGTCTGNQSASMSTFHIQLSTFNCSHPAASGNHSVNVNVNLRLVACPMLPRRSICKCCPGIPLSLTPLLSVHPFVCCDFCNEVEVHVACMSCVPFVPAFVDVATFDHCCLF